MNILEMKFLGNETGRWLLSLGIAALSFIILLVLKKIIANYVERHAKKTATGIDDSIVELIRKTHSFFLLLLSAVVGSYFLTLSPAVNAILQKIAVLSFLGQALVWGNSVLKYGIEHAVAKYRKDNASEATTVVALGYVGKAVLWSVILLLALDNLGVNINTLIAGLGIGGIAIALALQGILGDLLASLSVVLDKPFVLGDFIIIDNYLGTVERIGIKTTRIRSLSGEQIIFSNADLLKSRIRNYKRMYERRVEFRFGIVYETPVHKLRDIKSIVKTIIQSKEKTRFDRVHFKEYGDSGLIYEVVYYVLDPDYNVYMDIQESINLEIYSRFAEEGIAFAYPTRTVVMKNTAAELLGARK